MQSRTRSMSIPAAGEGTPSRWSWALKSSEAISGINAPLDPAHEAARVEDPIGIEGLLEGAHDRKPGWRRPPNVEILLECGRGRDHHDLPVGAGGQAKPQKGFSGGRRCQPYIDEARRWLRQHSAVRRNGRTHAPPRGPRTKGAE